MPADSRRSTRWASQRGRRTRTSQPTWVRAMAPKCSTLSGGRDALDRTDTARLRVRTDTRSTILALMRQEACPPLEAGGPRAVPHRCRRPTVAQVRERLAGLTLRDEHRL